ncbi:complement factor D-like isoform X2 [Choristoneura fumiferana]|uniref:complement factor D-like isoform X2 n=1 Tax=Choristoneura fumiferana TaxID=7141 RepID=UPI003D155B0C
MGKKRVRELLWWSNYSPEQSPHRGPLSLQRQERRMVRPEALPLTDVYAVAGTLVNKQFDKEGANNQWRTISRTVAPDDYVFPKRDIAMLFTSQPFTFNDHVNKIPYAREHGTYTDKGVICFVTGFGQTETGHQSDKLLWAKLEVLSAPACGKLHNRNTKRFICTRGALADVGVGDSGGPLVCKNTEHANEVNEGILVGVVSGKQVLRDGSDGKHLNNTFFTRVSSYKQWIETNKAQLIVPDIITLWISVLYFDP